MLLLVAACALLDADGRILMSKRPDNKDYGGLWEFPGGKIEDGEKPEQALRRELWEELGVEPCEQCFQPFSFVSHSYDDFDILMPLFLCRQWDGIPRPREGQEIRWVFPDRIRELKLVPADIPLAHEIGDRLKSGSRFEG